MHSHIVALDENVSGQIALNAERPVNLSGQPAGLLGDVRRIGISDEQSWIDVGRRNKGRIGLVPVKCGRTNGILRTIDLRDPVKSGRIKAAADAVRQVIVA